MKSNPQFLILNPQPSTLNPQLSTLNSQPSTLNPQFSTLNSQPSILNSQSLILNSQFSILNSQSSTLNPQFSTLNSHINREVGNQRADLSICVDDRVSTRTRRPRCRSPEEPHYRRSRLQQLPRKTQLLVLSTFSYS